MHACMHTVSKICPSSLHGNGVSQECVIWCSIMIVIEAPYKIWVSRLQLPNVGPQGFPGSLHNESAFWVWSVAIYVWNSMGQTPFYFFPNFFSIFGGLFGSFQLEYKRHKIQPLTWILAQWKAEDKSFCATVNHDNICHLLRSSFYGCWLVDLSPPDIEKCHIAWNRGICRLF